MARIRVIDVESSGDTPDGDKHGLVEIGYTDLVAGGTDLVGNPCLWEVEDGKSVLCNPGVPIPPQTSAIHNITDEDVDGLPNWKGYMRFLIGKLRTDDVIAIAGHGVAFEMKWIHPEWWGDLGPLPVLDTYKTALRVWTTSPLHSNNGLRYWRKPVGLVREKALPQHRAGPDSYVTAFLLRDLLNDGVTIEQMVEWTKLPALTLRCRLGKFRNDGDGTPWEEVDDGFLEWVLSKDFDEDTVFTVRHHLELRRRAAEEEQERLDLNTQFRANGLPETPPERIDVTPINEQPGSQSVPAAPEPATKELPL